MKTLMLLLVSFFATSQVKLMKETPVNVGEVLEFKLSYGWLTLGKANMITAEQVDSKSGRDSYKIDVYGKTGGLLGAFARVDDSWGGVFDKEDFTPYYSYRDVHEGDYILDEKTYFDYENQQVVLKQVFGKDKVVRPTKYYPIEKENTLDLMAGLTYARSIAYGSLSPGDTVKMDAYFDKEFYDFRMVYDGLDQIRTKVGKIKCYKVTPVMPDNKLFRGENAITFWLSADGNRLPLKVEASMFFGTLYGELTSYKNIKNGIDFQ